MSRLRRLLEVLGADASRDDHDEMIRREVRAEVARQMSRRGDRVRVD